MLFSRSRKATPTLVLAMAVLVLAALLATPAAWTMRGDGGDDSGSNEQGDDSQDNPPTFGKTFNPDGDEPIQTKSIESINEAIIKDSQGEAPQFDMPPLIGKLGDDPIDPKSEAGKEKWRLQQILETDATEDDSEDDGDDGPDLTPSQDELDDLDEKDDELTDDDQLQVPIGILDEFQGWGKGPNTYCKLKTWRQAANWPIKVSTGKKGRTSPGIDEPGFQKKWIRLAVEAMEMKFYEEKLKLHQLIKLWGFGEALNQGSTTHTLTKTLDRLFEHHCDARVLIPIHLRPGTCVGAKGKMGTPSVRLNSHTGELREFCAVDPNASPADMEDIARQMQSQQHGKKPHQRMGKHKPHGVNLAGGDDNADGKKHKKKGSDDDSNQGPKASKPRDPNKKKGGQAGGSEEPDPPQIEAGGKGGKHHHHRRQTHHKLRKHRKPAHEDFGEDDSGDDSGDDSEDEYDGRQRHHRAERDDTEEEEEGSPRHHHAEHASKPAYVQTLPGTTTGADGFIRYTDHVVNREINEAKKELESILGELKQPQESQHRLERKRRRRRRRRRAASSSGAGDGATDDDSDFEPVASTGPQSAGASSQSAGVSSQSAGAPSSKGLNSQSASSDEIPVFTPRPTPTPKAIPEKVDLKAIRNVYYVEVAFTHEYQARFFNLTDADLLEARENSYELRGTYSSQVSGQKWVSVEDYTVPNRYYVVRLWVSPRGGIKPTPTPTPTPDPLPFSEASPPVSVDASASAASGTAPTLPGGSSEASHPGPLAEYSASAPAPKSKISPTYTTSSAPSPPQPSSMPASPSPSGSSSDDGSVGN